jgi:hypothetical protein
MGQSWSRRAMEQSCGSHGAVMEKSWHEAVMGSHDMTSLICNTGNYTLVMSKYLDPMCSVVYTVSQGVTETQLH